MNYSSPWPGQEWETASRLLTERKLSLEPLIAHRGSFESFAQAVRDIARNAMPGKVLLIPETAGQRDAGPVLCKTDHSPMVPLRLH